MTRLHKESWLRRGFSVPNLISLLRLLLTIPMVMLLLADGWGYKLGALAIFIAGIISDTIDGILARRLGAITPLGTFLDPLADKIFVIAVFLTLLALDPELFPAWMLVLLIMREFLITYVRLVALEDYEEIKTERMGKLKTALQMLTLTSFLGLTIAWDVSRSSSEAAAALSITDWLVHWLPATLEWLALAPAVLMGASVLLTVISGIVYIAINRHMFQ